MYPGVHARTHPDKLAVVLADSDRTLTYRQLDDRSAALARVLHDAGLRTGDVVALLTDNQVEAFEVFWAALRSGLYITAVNSHLTPDEVAYIVEDSGAEALIVSATLGSLAEDVGHKVRARSARLAYGGPVPGFESYEQALAGAGPRLDDEPCGAIMLYSSGTTGFPKGIQPPLPDRRVDEPGEALVMVAQYMFGIGDADVYYSPAPIYHAAPLRWGGAIHALGGTVVLAEKFDPETALRHIEQYSITAGQMVPTMFVRMLKLDTDIRTRYDLSSLRVLIHAAAPCPPDVKRAMIGWLGPVIYEYYSSTEANGITFINSQEWLDHPGSVGKSVIGPAHICDDKGTVLAAGEVGTIYFESDHLPFTYHNDPEKTSTAQHPEHPTWTTVGDLGYLDDDGYLYLTDRKSFTIISGGVNIYPQEVENVLALHPAVDDVAVIGVPDTEMGEQVKAVVQLSPGTTQSPELAQELISYVRERVAHFKVPKSVDFVAELPRTPTGKLVKGKLKAAYTS
ncbi:AMP-binding protein [Rhodococcus chondri]|uniref:AMP-binding protein n=1 Tax=Rhodococcus chondri TaxID=3065941 RepID=A0ABU7JQM0_9NOCA|nr:AMP-binding protein [Rhodococcus sp. CC-R104]MEE2032312.1 AMP-binding protein [Rhodococcus sp. CC-R104]